MKKFLTTAAVAASVAFGGAAAANASCDAYDILDNGGWAQVVEQENNVYWVMVSDDYIQGQIGDQFDGDDQYMMIGAILGVHNICFGIGEQVHYSAAPDFYDEMAALGDDLYVGYVTGIPSDNVVVWSGN